MFGRAGADHLDGRAGWDTVAYWGSREGVTVNLATGEASGGDAQGDTLRGFEGVYGSERDDRLTGDSGGDYLYGGAGLDIVRYRHSDAGVTVNLATGTVSGGDAEGDIITGFENVIGSEHDDRLTGERGDDTLTGGGGADRFLFHPDDGNDGNDVITDFTDGVDRIDLHRFYLDGYEEVSARAVSGGVRIDLSAHGGGTVLLEDFVLADLDASDFLF